MRRVVFCKENSPIWPEKEMQEPTAVLTESMLAPLTARRQAILKLRFGLLPLTESGLNEVAIDQRDNAVSLRRQSLREIAKLFGISKERVRQIQNVALAKIGARLTPFTVKPPPREIELFR
jgi:RNA polymerase sigma factor (sigma-70 family)